LHNKYKPTLRACYFGYVTQAVVNNLVPLFFIIFQTSYHISYEKLGRLVLINFGTQIFADWLALRYVDRVGYRTSAVLAHGFAAAGLIALGVLPMLTPNPYTGLVIAVMIYAVGGGIIEVLISPIVDSLPGEAKSSAMSLLHSFYCWGQMGVVLVTTLLLWLLGTGIWFILPVLWALVPIWNLFRFRKVPLLPPVAEHERIPLRTLLGKRAFLVALVLMLCAGASELTMSQWSSLFAEKGLLVPKLFGDLLGPCLFAIFMGIGRTIHGVLGHKIHLQGAMLATASLCVVCYAVTIFAPLPIFSLLGCAFCGFSVSLMWPGTFSLAAAAFPKGGTAMFGLMAVFGDIGGSVGPWIAGFVSDLAQKSERLIAFGASISLMPEQMGLKAGLFVATVFPVVMLLGLAVFNPNAQRSASPVPEE
jgi:fucose permease